MLKVGEAYEVKVLLLDNDGDPVIGTVTYTVYDETDTSFATGTMTAVSGVTGFYTMTFTPDTAGEWTVRLVCLSPIRYAIKVFDVGKGVEQDIRDNVALVKTETDKIPIILTDTADMQPRIPRIVCKMDFKSLPLQITLTSTAGDKGLVDIVVSGLPAGVTIIAVEGIFYCDTVENTYDGINYLESTKIQVKKKTAGTDRDAITLEANKIFRFTDDMVRGGTVLTADWATAVAAGILAEVVGNNTYQMWFDVGETAQNNIVLDGAVFMLRIWFSV